MASPPKKAPDRHYNFESLNQVFAWSSLGLLVVTLWMVFADYAKPWKRFQAEFRDLERQKLVQEAEQERASLNETEIGQLEAKIASEQAGLAEQREEIRALEKEFSDFGKKVYASDVRMRTTKSHLDTAVYQLDSATQKGDPGRLERARETVDELQAQYQDDRNELEKYSESRDQAQRALDQDREGLNQAEGRLATLQAGLDGLHQRLAGLDKKLDYFILNAPLMDIFKPGLKIEQVLLSGLYQNINFTSVDRVDRCVTCHVASIRRGFDGEEWQEPFRSHPRRDLFLSAASPHPYTEFGCTTCHGGLDRATDFSRAGHSPTSEEQRQEWIDKYGWEPQHFLDTPILPAGQAEAGCVECHAGGLWTPESQLQDVGRELVTKMGCFACHTIDYPAFTDLPRPGPSLRKVASKTRPEWAYRWIEEPRAFRPTTWMPHFFFEENIKGQDNLERQRIEIASLVSYLWEKSERASYPAAPAGNAADGKALFESVGCTGCHMLDGEAARDQFYPQINRFHGPNLVNTGSKVSAGWLYAWLKDPKAYNPETRMPNLRLTDPEAADITAYLMSSRDSEYEGLSMPQVDGGLRDDLVLGYLKGSETIVQSHATLEAMSGEERDVYLGERTVRKYGCFGCHDVEGFDEAKPIGVELTEEGTKTLHQFDFGHVHDVPHTRHDWIKTKLLRPRIWDHGKEEVKAYHELYKMPNLMSLEKQSRRPVAGSCTVVK